MPLVKSASKEAVGENIAKEMAAGKAHKQAVAIALAVQRRVKEQDESDRAVRNPAKEDQAEYAKAWKDE